MGGEIIETVKSLQKQPCVLHIQGTNAHFMLPNSHSWNTCAECINWNHQLRWKPTENYRLSVLSPYTTFNSLTCLCLNIETMLLGSPYHVNAGLVEREQVNWNGCVVRDFYLFTSHLIKFSIETSPYTITLIGWISETFHYITLCLCTWNNVHFSFIDWIRMIHYMLHSTFVLLFRY
jgi:hypothetical protein